jgi:hypothetical protein
VPCECVISAHRTPDRAFEYAAQRQAQPEVIIAGAGSSPPGGGHGSQDAYPGAGSADGVQGTQRAGFTAVDRKCLRACRWERWRLAARGRQRSPAGYPSWASNILPHSPYCGPTGRHRRRSVEHQTHGRVNLATACRGILETGSFSGEVHRQGTFTCNMRLVWKPLDDLQTLDDHLAKMRGDWRIRRMKMASMAFWPVRCST